MVSFGAEPPLLSGASSVGLIHGGRCFRYADHAAAGLTEREMRSLLRSGDLRQIVRGVLVDTRCADEPMTRVAALDLVRPPYAVIGRRSAAWLRGIDVRGPSEMGPVQVECLVPAGCTPLRHPGVRCFSAPLVDDDVEEVAGVPCTAALRTAVDLLRYLPPHLGLGAADAMAHAGMVDVTALREQLERSHRGRNIARARRLAALCEPLTESFGESWTRLRIVDAGFPKPEAQVPLSVNGRVEFRLDLGYPARRLAVEYDGLQFHSSRSDRRHDEARRARIREVHGWKILVVGHGEVLGRSLAFERAMGELLGLEPQVLRRAW
jgi:hypothetical protein